MFIPFWFVPKVIHHILNLKLDSDIFMEKFEKTPANSQILPITWYTFHKLQVIVTIFIGQIKLLVYNVLIYNPHTCYDYNFKIEFETFIGFKFTVSYFERRKSSQI